MAPQFRARPACSLLSWGTTPASPVAHRPSALSQARASRFYTCIHISRAPGLLRSIKTVLPNDARAAALEGGRRREASASSSA
ncbi:hypothetical protein M433DRAFT_252294 [Acidomyces richmondensis BFW]|nr:hypothetical protein M433DRAFT_252294 [Acidomyces richmondensis BFW]